MTPTCSNCVYLHPLYESCTNKQTPVGSVPAVIAVTFGCNRHEPAKKGVTA